MNETFLRRAITILTISVIVVLAALAYAFFELYRSNSIYQGAESRRVRSYQLAMEMRQSADDLTRMARTFAATGLSEYVRQYTLVLDIRNGKVVRPQKYHQVYWDLMDPNSPVKPRPDSDEAISLRDLMEREGFPKAELEKLTQSDTAALALSELELRAMNAVKGKFEDRDGNYARIDLPNPKMAIDLLYGRQYYEAKSATMRPLEEFFNMMETRLNQDVNAAEAARNRGQTLFVGLMLAAFAMVGLLMFFERRSARIELAKRQAEVVEREEARKAAEQENETLNNSVISILEAVNRLSQRDLTARAPVTADIIGTVSDSINQLSEETSKVLHGVSGIAGQVEEVSNKVKAQADRVSRTAETERKSVGEMIESLFQATQTMNQVAALAEQSNHAAEQATAVTDSALETVTGTVKGMESIRETIAETEKRIKRLGERSQEISGIVNLINTISERTHVLALNASMQAAVAGEAGRGFAVVAEEVQRLAESSRNATQQIATLVNNIQIETNETINTVNRTIGQVVQGSEQAQKAGEQMRHTQHITAQLVAQVQRIALASDQQKSMSAQLLEAVQRIGQSTEDTAEQITAQNQETDTLLQASRRLVESVGVFKLSPA